MHAPACINIECIILIWEIVECFLQKRESEFRTNYLIGFWNILFRSQFAVTLNVIPMNRSCYWGVILISNEVFAIYFANVQLFIAITAPVLQKLPCSVFVGAVNPTKTDKYLSKNICQVERDWTSSTSTQIYNEHCTRRNTNSFHRKTSPTRETISNKICTNLLHVIPL